jgi:5-carboxymethyl-2-hydroxymuconate isomerase
MPHLRLEYSTNVTPPDLQQLFTELHRMLHDLAGIRLDNCKSRAQRMEAFRVGDGAFHKGFVHLELRFLSGRTLEVQQQVGQQALDTLERHFGRGDTGLQLTVEVGQIPRELYFKSPTVR